ncbi:hypothetical protein AALP_AA8G423000 [Arabis alpina]|uniref:Neprosin PEP catalytic domain-containing protein n=1 Tax=Arabis alpina TaxID=50452 RepID=A0A087GCY6_ARAAL|nr:hypothetical protein AALP_AA8G423000 [Arabis alpina]
MINPSFFPDARVWTFGFWKGKYGKGCYNTACYGFVQVSHVVPIVEPIDLLPGEPTGLHYSIHQDINTGNCSSFSVWFKSSNGSWKFSKRTPQ